MKKKDKSFSAKKLSTGQLAGVIFILPALVAIVALVVYPLLYGIYISFFNTNLVNKWDFVGLKYYQSLLTDKAFYMTLWRTLSFMLIVVAGHFVLGFLLASLLKKEFKGRLIFRIIFMLPWLFPESVIALLFKWILNPLYGIFNHILLNLGLIQENISWLGSSSTAFGMVCFVCIWKGYPMVMTMILSGLQTVPGDLYEAATIDGASKWKQFTNVTVPSIRPVLLSTLILDSVWWFKQYTTVYVLTAGGPGTSTNIVSIDIYKTAFQDFHFGKAAAMSVVVFVACWLISKIYQGVLKDDD